MYRALRGQIPSLARRFAVRKHFREIPIPVPRVATTLLLLALIALCSSSALATGWYNSSWLYRKKITIDHTEVGSTGAPHGNFPVLVNLSSDADLSANARADGYDILFTSSDGTTKLNHERESYTSGTGALIAWVQIPSLSASADTVLYMYYGNASATDQQNVNGTWNSGLWSRSMPSLRKSRPIS